MFYKKAFLISLILLILSVPLNPVFARRPLQYYQRGSTATTTTTQKKIEIISPNGGENLEAGTNYTIRFRQSGINAVSLHYKTVRGREQVIIYRYLFSELSTDEKFVWSVPKELGPEYNAYKIIIRGYKDEKFIAQDESNGFFGITPLGEKPVTLLSPNLQSSSLTLAVDYPYGGQVFKIGDIIPISWKQTHLARVSVGLISEDDGEVEWLTKNLVIHPNRNEGSFNWRIPPNRIFGDVYYKIYLEGIRPDVGTLHAVSSDFFAITKDGLMPQTASQTALPLAATTEVISKTEAKIIWEKQGGVTVSQGVLEYGLTQKYGKTQPVSSNESHGTVFLEGLLQGEVYHYRFRAGELTSADMTFALPGGVHRIGYYIVEAKEENVTVHIQWESQKRDFDLYFCKNACDESGEWTELTKTNLKDVTIIIPLARGELGEIAVVPFSANAASATVRTDVRGARIAVFNSGQFVQKAEGLTPRTLRIGTDRLFNSVSGKILLKTQDSGKLYYVNPKTRLMTYLGNQQDAFVALREQGVGITNVDLEKIPAGFGYAPFQDTDGDSLADVLEKAIGTSIYDKDSDGDGYTDRLELDKGYSPTAARAARLSIDAGFAKKNAGMIFLQLEQGGQAWYVSPRDAKRYFIGDPAIAWYIITHQNVGISNHDFEVL